MSLFCSICLRSKQNIRSIKNENLINFYDELCDYASGSKTRFCAECMYKLNKCFEFKKYCRLAAEKLKTWTRQPKEKKKPINLLYTEMPESQLSLCNKNNYKIYIYQTEDVDEATPIQISSSRSPHIVTVNIPASAGQMQDSVEELNLCQTDHLKETVKEEQEIKVEFVDFTDNDDQLDMDVTDETKTIVEKKRKLSEELGTEDDLTDSDISVRNTNSDNDDSDGLGSDESMKEVKKMLEILDKQTSRNEEEITKRKRKPIDIEQLRTKLEEKFKRCEPVKDEDGNIIDKDVVLNNLDKVMHLFTLKRVCLGPGPFGPSAIRKLAKIHKHFANDDSALYIKVFFGTQAEILAEFQKRRQHINYTRFPHRCEQCLKGFPQSWLLEYHRRSSHNPEKPFECPICQVRNENKRYMQLHINSHKRVLKCKLCTFTCAQKYTMVSHVNKHNGVKYTCEQCGNIYSNPSGLAAHLNTHSARHICALCADAFVTLKGFRLHKNKKHAGEVFVEDKDNTKCEECNILFLSSHVYNKHVRKTHKEQRETVNLLYTCRLCDWKGPKRALQMEHYRTEHPEETTEPHKDYNLLCHDCGKRFKYLHMYKDHMNMHNGTKPHACTKCPKTFSSRMVLYTHMKSHLAPSKECPHCGKKFTTGVGLRNHIQRHLPPTKECPHCGKMFTTNTGLSVHLRIHRNDRRFKCHICGKGFLHSSSLTAHVAGVHYNKRRQRKPRQQDMDIDTD